MWPSGIARCAALSANIRGCKVSGHYLYKQRRKRFASMGMDRQEAIEFLVDHYNNPRNRGALEGADIDQVGGNPGCSDRVEMYAKIGPDGRIEEVSFEGEGCTISMAAASSVTEMVQGM